MDFQNDFNKVNSKIQEVFKNWDNKKDITIPPEYRHICMNIKERRP